MTAPIKSFSSTQKWKTYTHCARISPRYSGSCNQRVMKMKAGSGFNLAFCFVCCGTVIVVCS